MKIYPLKNRILFSVVFVLGSGVFAAPIAIDQFDYAGGESLSGKGSALDAGWGGAWTSADWNVLSGGSLTGTDATPSVAGNLVVGSGSGRVYRDFDTTYSDATTQTLYMSFIRQDSSTVASRYMAFGLNLGGNHDSFRTFQLGALSTDGGGNAADVWARANNDTVSGTLGARNTNAEYYVVEFNLVNGGDDTINIWRNPSTAELLSSADASITVGSLSFDRVALASWGTSSLSMDEFRFGTSINDVAVIPEGSSLLLVGLALGTLLIWRRRN